MVTLVDEAPFAAVVKDNFLSVACSFCFNIKEDRAFMKCSKCKAISYCNKECQKNDSKNHEHECQFFKKSDKIPPYICRLISRIAMKTRRNEANQPAFNGRKYEELMDHREELEKNPVRLKIFENVHEILKDFMGEKFVPREICCYQFMDEFTQTVLEFGQCTMLDRRYMSASFVRISIHDHSCRPDVYYCFENGRILLRSPNKGTKYSTELKINYIDLTKTTKERREHLSSQYYFECNCTRCSEEENAEWEESAYSPCCPESICKKESKSEDLKCYKCGTVNNTISRNEVEEANQAIIGIWESQSNKDAVDILVVMKTYEKYSKVLSPYNLNLFKFAKHLLDFSLEKQNPTLMVKYANAVLPVYEHYLGKGNPALSYGLQHISTAKLFAAVKQGKPDKTVVELLQKALEASEISHGPKHLVTTGIRQIMVKNLPFLLS